MQQLGVFGTTNADALLSYHEEQAKAHLEIAGSHFSIALDHIQFIHENNLYPGDWASYVKRTFGTSRQHLERHIAHAETLSIISTIGAPADIPEGTMRPINNLKPDLRRFAYSLAAGVAERQGVKLTHLHTDAAAETVKTMVLTGNIQVTLEEVESYARVSKWELIESVNGVAAAQSYMTEFYKTHGNDNVRISFYVEKPVSSDAAPSGDVGETA